MPASPPSPASAAETADPAALAVGLQEWSVICRLLMCGQLVCLVRKGGIHERQGRFVPEHQRFALMETHLHQDTARLHADIATTWADVLAETGPPGRIAVPGWAEVAAVWRVGERARLDRLAGELVWTPAELDARFAYRADRGQAWLHVLLLRATRYDQPHLIADDPAYAGCRSWIPLRAALPTMGTRVLSDAAFAARQAAFTSALGPAAASPT